MRFDWTLELQCLCLLVFIECWIVSACLSILLRLTLRQSASHERVSSANPAGLHGCFDERKRWNGNDAPLSFVKCYFQSGTARLAGFCDITHTWQFLDDVREDEDEDECDDVREKTLEEMGNQCDGGLELRGLAHNQLERSQASGLACYSHADVVAACFCSSIFSPRVTN